jgi:hypothetical protein
VCLTSLSRADLTVWYSLGRAFPDTSPVRSHRHPAQAERASTPLGIDPIHHLHDLLRGDGLYGGDHDVTRATEQIVSMRDKADAILVAETVKKIEQLGATAAGRGEAKRSPAVRLQGRYVLLDQMQRGPAPLMHKGK